MRKLDSRVALANKLRLCECVCLCAKASCLMGIFLFKLATRSLLLHPAVSFPFQFVLTPSPFGVTVRHMFCKSRRQGNRSGSGQVNQDSHQKREREERAWLVGHTQATQDAERDGTGGQFVALLTIFSYYFSLSLCLSPLSVCYQFSYGMRCEGKLKTVCHRFVLL